MTMQMLWGLCLVVSALMTGVGVELSLAGEGPLASYPLVVAGILLLPAAAAALDRWHPEAAAAGPRARREE